MLFEAFEVRVGCTRFGKCSTGDEIDSSGDTGIFIERDFGNE